MCPAVPPALLLRQHPRLEAEADERGPAHRHGGAQRRRGPGKGSGLRRAVRGCAHGRDARRMDGGQGVRHPRRVLQDIRRDRGPRLLGHESRSGVHGRDRRFSDVRAARQGGRPRGAEGRAARRVGAQDHERRHRGDERLLGPPEVQHPAPRIRWVGVPRHWRASRVRVRRHPQARVAAEGERAGGGRGRVADRA